MLVLSRRLGEQVIVSVGDHEIIVQVVGVTPGRVRLGVVAPDQVIVDREEVWRRRSEWQTEKASCPKSITSMRNGSKRTA